MNHTKYQKWISVSLFSLTIFAFLAFFLCINEEEHAVIYQSENLRGYDIFSDMSMELTNDDSAPAGVQKIYRGYLPSMLSQEDYFCFNISHHNIRVYFNDELVYSLIGSEANRIAQNVSSNWCIIHVGQTHAGKEITVVLTPLFEAAISKSPEFILGSPYIMTIELFLGELPLLILSSLCILIGIFVIAIFLYFHLNEKTDNRGIIYLGFFSLFIGLWKLTDLRCMSLLMPKYTMALGYISVGSLFLTGICLMQYFSTLFVKGKQKVLTMLSCAGCVLCLVVLILQLLGITEIRQNLIYSHILLIIALVSVPITALINRIVSKTWGLQKSWKLLFLLFAGIVLDLMLYYNNNKNGLLSFSIMSLIIYTLIIFQLSIQDITRRAYTDIHTGLVNHAHWIKLMNKNTSIKKPFAILMIDINGLKQVNDKLGHDAGDQMIFQLSYLLRTTLPHTAVICRWGGDEFTVFLNNIDRIQLEHQIAQLILEGKRYNKEHPKLPIHFSVGAVLSSEHPGLSRQELFQLADEEMYLYKKKWYEDHPRTI